MSKSKQYRKKRESKGNIFVILVVLLVVLIVVAIVGTSIDNSQYNGLLRDYTEFTYGERENVKLQRVTGMGVDAFSNENYSYYVEDDIIYDSKKNVTEAAEFKTKSEAAAKILGTISQAEFYTYTNGSDFSVNYDYVIVEAAATETIGSEDAAAQMIYDYIAALGEDYNICGLYLGLNDGEFYYSVLVDVMKKQTVTLEAIKENLTATQLTIEIAPETEGETEEAPAEDAE